MAPIDYKTLLEQAFAEYGAMVLDRQALDLNIAKKKQFIKATMNMLPDEDRAALEEALDKLSGESLGLTDAIRKVLQNEPKKSFTATDVRDKLKKSSFDFSSYKTNPLASIHAVLKRLKPEEVETTEIDGVAAWRWVGEVAGWPRLTYKGQGRPVSELLAAMKESLEKADKSQQEINAIRRQQRGRG
jgi:hypothetical protein